MNSFFKAMFLVAMGLALSAFVSAQTVILPNELAGADAAFGAGTLANSAHRSQQVYGAGEFGWVTGAVLITELRLRPDYFYGKAFSATVSNIQINLSTTTRAPEALSSTFADNVGSDDTVVFMGELRVSSSFTGPAGGPKEFDIVVPFISGFVYDPAAGNLLLDIRNFSGSTASLVAGQAVNGDGASRVLGSVSSSAGAPDNGADALMIVVTPTTASNAPPLILVQPQSRTAFEGSSVSFSVLASGTPQLSYLWLHNNTTLPDATNSSLNLANITSADAGPYIVIVANAFGSVTSQVATLTLADPLPSGLVVPNELADADAGFGAGTLANSAHRSQQVYAASEFGTVTGALLITELRLRPDHIYGGAFSATVSNIQVNLSTTQKVPEGLSATFADNVGVDDQVVFSGVLNVTSSFSGPASGPKAFDIQIPLTTPFLYDPSAGNLVVDIRNYSGSSASLVAGQGVNGDGASRVLGHVSSSSGVPDYGADAFLIVVSTPTTGTNMPPVILVQPQSRTALEGTNVSFRVVASGTPELTFQWLHNEVALPNATNSVLSLSNVGLADAGPYTVIVANSFGSVTSQVAMLTVTQPPASVRVIGGNAAGGGAVKIPVQIRANGNENAIGFSLNFDRTILTFSDVGLGSGTPASAAFILNTNEAASGRLGLGIGLPADASLAHGTQELVIVTFLVAPVINQTTTTISFGDVPTLRQLSDKNAQALPAVYSQGNVSISDSQLEGDLAPRPDGNRAVSIIDWVQMGRFVALLDTIAGTNEFQRADCAPRAMKGNGVLGASDWVQVGRYAIGLDPLSIAGGPSEPDGGGGGGFMPASSGTKLSVLNSSIAQGQTNVVPVVIESLGAANAMTFSVTFEPAKLAFVAASIGSAAGGAALNLNLSQAAAGRIGLALALPPGSSFANGTREVVQLRFAALATAPASTAVGFGNEPVPREVSDAQANTLSTTYVPGTVSVTPPPGPPLRVTRSGNSLFLTWPSSASGFDLEATAGALDTAWSTVPGVIDLGEQKLAIVPMSGGERFFRLKKP